VEEWRRCNPPDIVTMDVVATTVTVFPNIHLSVGAAIASVAMNISIFFGFSIFTWVAWWAEEEDEDTEEQGPGLRIPAYLRAIEDRRMLNLGVVGAPGSGKSSLINALRRLSPDDPTAAPVGVLGTTVAPESYLLRLDPWVAGDHFFMGSPEACREPVDAGGDSANLIGPREVRIWDLPGLGTHKQEAYVSEMGLACFDVVLIVFSQRITGSDLELAHRLEDIYKVPYLAVRSQVDLDVESEAADNGSTEEEVLCQLRADATNEGLGNIFLVSARQPARFEFAQLVDGIAHVAKARHRAYLEIECPICFESFDQDEGRGRCTCHWCGNAVCGRCAQELRGVLGEAQCPFCRRWTSLSKPPIL